jgi:poly-gamma-glutamate capsule biosynthesis protein CapA/YwtB (metallophosphatase superfamily)
MIINNICIIIVFFLFFSANKNDKVRTMNENSAHRNSSMTLFLCGDVMTGRGIDQILAHSVDPILYEPYVKDAGDYVELAEQENGHIEQPVSYSYIWGDAMDVWEKKNPAVKIINLETSITTHNEPWPGKGINYRMHPGNIEVLTSAGIDFCSLANNHILDWSQGGLLETIRSLEKSGIAYAGAGENLSQARKPAVLKHKDQRVLVFSYGSETSGIPKSWAATFRKPGVGLLPDLDKTTVKEISGRIGFIYQPGDITIFSVHWGSNWGYKVVDDQRHFARHLIDNAGVDIVHGHSSHHPRGVEVYNNKLIIYGAGDFINDYEGISGHEQYRGDLTLMYFPEISLSDGNLEAMTIIPMQIKQFRLNYVSKEDALWLYTRLNKDWKNYGTSLTMNDDNTFTLHW